MEHHMQLGRLARSAHDEVLRSNFDCFWVLPVLTYTTGSSARLSHAAASGNSSANCECTAVVTRAAFMTAVEDNDADGHQALLKMNIKEEPTEARQVGSKAVHFMQRAVKIEQDAAHDGSSGMIRS
jgi:hypothetical protein